MKDDAYSMHSFPGKEIQWHSFDTAWNASYLVLCIYQTNRYHLTPTVTPSLLRGYQVFTVKSTLSFISHYKLIVLFYLKEGTIYILVKTTNGSQCPLAASKSHITVVHLLVWWQSRIIISIILRSNWKHSSAHPACGYSFIQSRTQTTVEMEKWKSFLFFF